MVDLPPRGNRFLVIVFLSRGTELQQHLQLLMHLIVLIIFVWLMAALNDAIDQTLNRIERFAPHNVWRCYSGPFY